MKSADSRMFMSWIILPFTVKDFREEKSLDNLSKILKTNDTKYLLPLVDWVKEHPLHRGEIRSYESVKAAYERLIKDIFL